MSMNEADTRYHLIDPLLREKGYVSCERTVWTISMTSCPQMCCSRRLLSIWRQPWRRSGMLPPDCKEVE